MKIRSEDISCQNPVQKGNKLRSFSKESYIRAQNINLKTERP